jgi:hypothetical protein
VILEAGADVAAEHSAAASMRQWPWLMPMTSHSEPAGMIFVWSWSDSTCPGMPPSTFTMNENW